MQLICKKLRILFSFMLDKLIYLYTKKHKDILSWNCHDDITII